MKKSFSVPTNVLSKNWLNCPHLIDNSFMLIQLNGMYQLYECYTNILENWEHNFSTYRDFNNK